MEKLHVYTFIESQGSCLLPAAVPGHSSTLTKESSYQMTADPLVWCQQLDDWQRLPGQGIVEAGDDVLLAHQLRGRDRNPLVSAQAPATPLLPPPGGQSAARARQPRPYSGPSATICPASPKLSVGGEAAMAAGWEPLRGGDR